MPGIIFLKTAQITEVKLSIFEKGRGILLLVFGIFYFIVANFLTISKLFE
jgi:hypothetical protein